VDIYKLAADLHVDAVVPGDELRAELARRFEFAAPERSSRRGGFPRKRSVTPV
jgi:hypothetical protein